MIDSRVVALACLALTVICCTSRAQVDASLLRPGVDTLAYYDVNVADTIRRGTLRQELRVQQFDDRRRVVLLSELRTEREPSVDPLILAFDGLKPVAESGHGYSIQYTEGKTRLRSTCPYPTGRLARKVSNWCSAPPTCARARASTRSGFSPEVRSTITTTPSRPPLSLSMRG